MALNEELKEFYIKNMPGMNNQIEDLDLKTKWVENAQNCRFEPEPGSVDKRDPLTYYNSTSKGTGAVTGLYRYYTKGGVTKFIMVHATTCYVGTDSGGTWTEIRSSLTTGKRMSFEVYKDLLICSNGYDNPFVYDGSTDNVTWELGGCKAVLENDAGYNIDKDSTLLSYKITIDADAYICGSVSNTIATVGGASNGRIQLSNIPLGPVGATNRKIFRKNAGTDTTGAAWNLVTTLVNNTATTYTDDTADVSGTAAIDPDTDDMPVGSILKLHRERLFITGDPSNPNTIYYSNPYRPGYIDHTTNSTYMDVAADDGDEIMGVPIQLGVMVCIKKNTCRKLHITSGTSGADPTTWYAEDPDSYVGSPAQWSITQTPYGIMFLGWDHWYVHDGMTAKPIIAEFDTEDILPASYADVVGYYHNGIMLAAYADKVVANKFHDRIMRWNFKRKSLGIDLWTSAYISGANCFAAKIGDDETGELYFGDSQNGYVIKAKESEESYRLRTKTEVNNGTASSAFIGGTENSPYIEIGSITSASTIPDDVVIFWDSETTTPGSGWTEITSTYDGKFVALASSLSTSAASTHSHTASGNLPSANPPIVNTGDQGGGNNNFVNPAHTHTFGFATSGIATEPRYVKYRIFKSDSCATTEFPDGAIIIWEDGDAPTGWEGTGYVGYYVKVGTSGLGSVNGSSHGHTASGTSSHVNSPGESSDSGSPTGASGTHGHTVVCSIDDQSLDSWELTNVSMYMIKKTGESSTWNGVNNYCYCPVIGATTPTGWTLVSTYDDRYIKMGSGDPATGEASGAAHTHTMAGGTSGVSDKFGNDYDRTQGIKWHTHSFTGTVSSGDATAPSTVSFRLFKFVLGKMKDYNAASTVAATNGVWESPGAEITADALGKMYWNESIANVTNDDVTFHVRAGATQAAVEDATNITSAAADGGDIEFTLVAHGLVSTDRVIIGAATTMPTGVSASVLYYVIKTGNDIFKISLTSGGTEIAWADDGTGQLTFKKWEEDLTDPNGSTIATTTNIWFQYLIVLTAADTTLTNPQVYFTNSYVVKYTYNRSSTLAETSVNFTYDIGFRNFDLPFSDKFFKLIGTTHVGADGSYTLYWETENSSNSFSVSLETNPDRWQSMMHDTALGREINFNVSKNDLYSFRLNEIKGLFSPQPTIL